MKYSHSLIPTLFTLLATVDASPTNNYPLALQFPPVIQLDKPYSYQLAPNTFTSNTNQIKYTARGLPDWLNFDSDSRTISGTAPSSYFSNAKWSQIWFELLATDSTGQTTVNSSLAISNMDLATISTTYSLKSDLTSPGAFSSDSNLILTPDEEFYISFTPDIFQASSSIVQYNALTSSHAPLPTWLKFDTSSLSFSGRAPAVNSDVSPSDSYSISVMAIQIPGFSSASVDFQITIGAHQFTTNVTNVNQSVIPDENFLYNIPLDKMLLDNAVVSVPSISNVTIDPKPDWLSVDHSSIALNGNVPKSFKNSTYTVTVTNIYKDQVKLDLLLYTKPEQNSSNEVSSLASIFKKNSLAAINATNDKFFQYQLPDSAVNTMHTVNANISASYDPIAPWLTFHKSNLTFVGEVPSSFSGTTVILSNDQNQSDSISLTIRSTLPVTSSVAPTATTSSLPAPKYDNNRLIAIICGTAIPIVTILLLVIAFFCCIRRKKSMRAVISASSPSGSKYEENQFHKDTPSIMTSAGLSSTDKISAFSTPVLSGSFKKNREEWDSPTMATEFNMYKLDNPKLPYLQFGPALTSRSFAESEMTRIGDENHTVTPMKSRTFDSTALSSTSLPLERALAPSGIQPTLAVTPVVLQPPAMVKAASTTTPTTDPSDHNEFNFTIGKPQHSWRQNGDPARQLHGRTQGGSLATIATDELVSVRMVDEARRSRLSNRASQSHGASAINVQSEANLDDASNYDQSETPSSRPVSKPVSIGTYSSAESEYGNPYMYPIPPNSVADNLDSSNQMSRMQSVAHEDSGNFKLIDNSMTSGNSSFLPSSTPAKDEAANAYNSIRLVKEE
jgi:hypothetical protein